MMQKKKETCKHEVAESNFSFTLTESQKVVL